MSRQDGIEQAKKCIERGKMFLAKNDLDGFYTYLQHEISIGKLDPFFAPEVTFFLENCGINTLANLKDGIVPMHFADAMGSSLPETMLTNGCLKFPSNIEFISTESFCGQKADGLDLRGVRWVDKNAFVSCRFNYIYIDDKAKYYTRGPLASSTAGTIYVPKSMSEDVIKSTIANLYAKTEVVWNDNIERVERY